MTPVDILLESMQVASLHGITPDLVRKQSERLEEAIKGQPRDEGD